MPPSPVILWIELGGKQDGFHQIWIPWRNAHKSHQQSVFQVGAPSYEFEGVSPQSFFRHCTSVCMHSVLEYASLAWSGISQRDGDRLEQLKRSSVRLIVGVRLCDRLPTEHLLARAGLIPLSQRLVRSSDHIRVQDHQTATSSSQAHWRCRHWMDLFSCSSSAKFLGHLPPPNRICRNAPLVLVLNSLRPAGSDPRVGDGLVWNPKPMAFEYTFLDGMQRS